MEYKIEKQEFKPLVEREEIYIRVVDSKITPSNVQVKAEVSKMLDKPQELVVIKRISQKFGKNESEVLLYVYKNEEALKKFEPKPKKSKQEKSGEGEEKSE